VSWRSSLTICSGCGSGRTSRPGATDSADGRPPRPTTSTRPPPRRSPGSTGPPGTMSGQVGASERPTTSPTLLSRTLPSALPQTSHRGRRRKPVAWLRPVGVPRGTRARVINPAYHTRHRADFLRPRNKQPARTSACHDMGRRISSMGRQPTGFSTTSRLPTPCFTSPSTMTTRRARCQITAS
jgi:hypothetical protein